VCGALPGRPSVLADSEENQVSDDPEFTDGRGNGEQPGREISVGERVADEGAEHVAHTADHQQLAQGPRQPPRPHYEPAHRDQPQTEEQAPDSPDITADDVQQLDGGGSAPGHGQRPVIGDVESRGEHGRAAQVATALTISNTATNSAANESTSRNRR
jgi:hypothetical protein